MTQMNHDALAPAQPKEIYAFIKTLKSKPRKRWWFLFFLIFSLTIISMTLSSTLLGRVVDIISGRSVPILGSGTPAIIWTIVIVILCSVLEQAGRALARFIINAQSRRISVDIRQACLTAVMHAPIPEIMLLGTGNIITRITKDIDRSIRILNAIGVRLVIAILMFPFTIISLVLFSPWYFLIFIFVALIMIPAVKRNIATMPSASNKVSAAQAKLNNRLLDTVRSLPTLRRLRIENWAVKRLEKTSWQTIQAEADRVPLVNTILRHGNYAYSILVILTLVTSVILNHFDLISPGDGTAAMILVLRLEMAVFNILFFAGDIQNGITSIGRAVSLALLSQDTKEKTLPDLNHAPDVRIENLSFMYPNGAEIIHDMSITFHAGTTTAIVGTSGAGKSTIGNLIAGLQKANQGSIRLIDQNRIIDSQEVSDTWWTSQVSLISQEVHLFSGTLRDDLLLAIKGYKGRSTKDYDEQIYAALKEVGLEKNTAQWARWFPHDLETIIGGGAEPLPAEVVQQIALARIILRDPKVLIMDEATSEAGSQTAQILEKASINVAKGRTSIIIAHRLDQAMMSDRILLVSQGKIIEDGTHEELIALGKGYAQLFERWQK